MKKRSDPMMPVSVWWFLALLPGLVIVVVIAEVLHG